MKPYAIIPARGGSKRIPYKNIVEICGKPMIGRVIEVCRNSDLFEDILVSTDCAKIAEISRSFGANVPELRPADLSDDFVGTDQVIRHEINQQSLQLNEVCCIYPTAILLQKDHLRKSYRKFMSHQKGYVFSAAKFSHAVQRSMRVINGTVEMLFPSEYQKRSQDLEPIYYDAGMFYWAKGKTWLLDKPVFGEGSSIFEIAERWVQDIDTFEDLELAKIKFGLINDQEN